MTELPVTPRGAFLQTVHPLLGRLLPCLLVFGFGALLAACRGFQNPQTAPRLRIEGVRQITDDTYLYERPVWSPDGRLIAAARNINNQLDMGPDTRAWEVVIIDAASGDITRLYGPAGLSLPTWSPRGDRLAYVTELPFDDKNDEEESSRRLTIHPIAGGEALDVPCETCAYPNWLEDGTILVSVNLGLGGDGRPQYGTARLNLGTGELEGRAPYVGMSDVYVEVSQGEPILIADISLAAPNGEALFMTAYVRDCSGIWIYNFGSDGPKPLIDNPESDECDPSLSVDGTRLLYTLKAPRQLAATTIMVADSDGSSPVALLDPGGDPYQARFPAWSPDGTKFAFAYGLFQDTAPSYSALYIADIPPALQTGAAE